MNNHNRKSNHPMEVKPMPAKVLFRCHPDLKVLLENRADSDGLAGGMNELIVRVIGNFFRRPDLAKVPRRKRGPKGPRKKMMAGATNENR